MALGTAHIFLHVMLCAAAQQAKPDAPLATHVLMGYQAGDPNIDQTFTTQRGTSNEQDIEFDVPTGYQHLSITMPAYKCSADAYVVLLRDRDRVITETLTGVGDLPERPVLLMNGYAPPSFTYVKPTFVVFDGTVACDKPVTPPLQSHIDVSYDQGAFYAQMFYDPTLTEHQPVFALSLRMPGGRHHYVRLPIDFPSNNTRWPSTVRMDVTQDMVTGIATEPTETLLCPKIWTTAVH